MTKEELKELEGQTVWVIPTKEIPAQERSDPNYPSVLQCIAPHLHTILDYTNAYPLTVLGCEKYFERYFPQKYIFRTRKEALICIKDIKEREYNEASKTAERLAAELAEVNKALEVEG